MRDGLKVQYVIRAEILQELAEALDEAELLLAIVVVCFAQLHEDQIICGTQKGEESARRGRVPGRGKWEKRRRREGLWVSQLAR